MDAWIYSAFLLCSIGFLFECRPSEPYLTEYLIGPWVNLTEHQVYHQVFPVATYSYLAVIIFAFLLTDILRYKPVIIIEGLSYVITWMLLIWGKTLLHFQMVEFTYATALSMEVAYYTYIYTKVTKEHYQKVTTYTRMAILLGRFTAAVLAQLLLSLRLMDYFTLNYISLASVSAAVLLSLFLPRASHTIYFHPANASSNQSVLGTGERGGSDSCYLEPDKSAMVSSDIVEATSGSKGSKRPGIRDALSVGEEATIDSSSGGEMNRTIINPDEVVGDLKQVNGRLQQNLSSKIIKAYQLLWDDAKSAYTQPYLVKWSVWWAFATCGNLQIGNYIQPLWESIVPSTSSNENIYNGAVEATQTLLSALVAFLMGYVTLNWSFVGEAILLGVSLIQGGLLISMSTTDNIWIAYGAYILFRIFYQMMITVASFEVATQLKHDSYGLIFGLNTFLALVFQTILTVVFVEEIGLGLQPKDQFFAYGFYFVALGIGFLLTTVISCCSLGMADLKRQRIWISQSKVVSEFSSPDEAGPSALAPIGTTEAI